MIENLGRSEVFDVLTKDIIEEISYSTNSKIQELQQILDNYHKLEDEDKKLITEKKIDKLATQIFFDKKINSLNDPIFYKKIFFPIIKSKINFQNIKIFPIASFFVRLNLPNYKFFYSNWHQDTATFLYNKSKYYKFKSYTLWVALTKAAKNNSLEFIDKNYYEDKIFDCKFEISKRHGEVRFKNSILPSSVPLNIKTSKFDFNEGQGIIFDSLIFHRTVRNNRKIRLSFDLRVFSEEPDQQIKNFTFKNKIKRKIFETFNYKLLF